MYELSPKQATIEKRKPTLGRWAMAVGAALALVASLAGCSDGVLAGQSGTEASDSSSDTFFTTDRVHTINVDFDDAEYEEMMTAYAETGDKNWISVTVDIDGTTFENVGLRLKGNRSLRELLADSRGIELTEADLEAEDSDGDSSPSGSTDPATIPWLIRLDKYVDGQEYMGRYDFVVRGNDTETYLNEAVAMAMIEEAGLPAHRVAFTSFSVNGDDAALRLVSEVPDDELWNEEWFGTEGATWKADSDGDWDYHGDDGADYESIWKQRTGTDDIDMTPIVEFMNFINNATDEEFEDSLADQLDVEQFATYLAVESLIGNEDTISGPGNNGYLHYDPETGLMTVVAWDHDATFGGMGGFGASGVQGGPGGMGAPGENDMFGGESDQVQSDPNGAGQMGPSGRGPGGMQPPTEGTVSGEMIPPDGNTPPEGMPNEQGTTAQDSASRPEDMSMPQSMDIQAMGGFGGGGMAGSNVLESRFMASTAFNQMYQTAYTYLQASLITNGFAEEVLNRYAQLLLDDAGDLISADTVEVERAAIQQYLTQAASSSPDNVGGMGVPRGMGGTRNDLEPEQSGTSS